MARRRCLTLGAIVICALLSLSCAWLTGPRLGQPRPTATPRPTLSPSDRAKAIQRVDEKLKAFANHEFTVEFTELEANSYVSEHLREALPLRSLWISFQPGQIVLEGDLTGPIQGRATLTAKVDVVAGQVQTQIQSATLSGIPIPRFALASLSDGITQMAKQASGAVEITRIEVSAGRLLVSGHRR